MPTPDRLTLRPVEPADVPALLDIIRAARREYGLAERGVELLDASDQALYAAYQRQRSLYFVAVLDDELVGGAGVGPLSGADPLTCELQRMYLRPGARGRGIGKALLERCLSAARQFLYVRCYLETVAAMDGAIGFYRRHGFRDLEAPMAGAARGHSERWMLRALRASARASVGGAPAMAVGDLTRSRVTAVTAVQ